MLTVIPFQQRSRIEQEIFIREIHLRKAKLNNASDLSVLFALFAVLGAVDLGIQDGDDPNLICAYVIATALLVSNTVIVKIGLLWMLPGLDTALLLARYDVVEFDHVPPLFILWDVLWILASMGGFLIFGTQFLLIMWIKFPFAIAPTIIMAPVLSIALFSMVVSCGRIGKPILNHGTFQKNLDALQNV